MRDDYDNDDNDNDNDTARYCRGLQHLNIQDVAGVSLQGYRAVRAHCRR